MKRVIGKRVPSPCFEPGSEIFNWSTCAWLWFIKKSPGDTVPKYIWV